MMTYKKNLKKEIEELRKNIEKEKKNMRIEEEHKDYFKARNRYNTNYNKKRLFDAELKGYEIAEKEFADWLQNKLLKNQTRWLTYTYILIKDKIKELRGKK